VITVALRADATSKPSFVRAGTGLACLQRRHGRRALAAAHVVGTRVPRTSA
jgi:hypothetical protein